MKGNRTNVTARIADFFQDNSGEYSIKEIANALGLSPNTASQYALGMVDRGELTRRFVGGHRGGHYVYNVPGAAANIRTFELTLLGSELFRFRAIAAMRGWSVEQLVQQALVDSMEHDESLTWNATPPADHPGIKVTRAVEPLARHAHGS